MTLSIVAQHDLYSLHFLGAGGPFVFSDVLFQTSYELLLAAKIF